MLAISGRFRRTIAWLTLWSGSCLAQTTAATVPAASVHGVQRVANTYFFLQTDATGKREALMARKRTEATQHKLFDLQTLSPGDQPSEFEIQPSWDAKYVAIGVFLGREGYLIRVIDAVSGALLPESISRSFDGDASWSDDNSAFYYRKFQQVPAGAPRSAIFTNMRVYLHRLGDDPNLDRPVFGSDVNVELHLPEVGAVNAFPMPGTSLLLAVQASGPTELDSFWVSDTQEQARRWKKIIDHADEVLFEFSSRGSTLYFITRHNQYNGRLMAFDAAREAIPSARQILAGSDLQLADRHRDGILCAMDALYVYGHRKDASALIRVPYDDPAQSTEISLPFAGVIADVSGDTHTPGLAFSLVGEGHRLTIYEYDPSQNRLVDTRLTQ